ncbi:unnamed protein product [Paramecium sonneborni]|uniref:Uncharacterized protein n=1 Tax=Paramecium sonneborni TaxID=65129 RepID=A0A8S1PC50_9CILI|nr:unnamed protein product [Paramecium sonneborni]
MKYKKFLTSESLFQMVKSMDLVQLRYLENRINIAYQLNIEFVGLYMAFQENFPFFEIYLGTNIKNQHQDFSEMLKVIKKRKSESFDNLKQNEQKNEIYCCLQQHTQHGDNLKIKVELIQQYLEFVSSQFTQFKWNRMDEINKHPLYSYLIDDIDYVTKSELVIPSFWLQMDTFLLPPALVNQSTFFDYIIRADTYQQSKTLSQYNKISNQIAIYLFEIRDLLQQFANKKLQIQIFPSLFNFNFIRKDNQEPFYLNKKHFEIFIVQNSRVYAQTRSQTSYFADYLEYNNQIQLKIFNFYPFDQIGQGLILIQNNKYREENTKEFQQYWSKLYKQKHPTQGDVESLQIQVLSLEYLHSLNCKVNSPFEYIQHIIDQETMRCRKCKEQIYDYGTLFYDFSFYQFFQCLRDILLSPYYIDIPGVYICPITLMLLGVKKNFKISSQILNEKGEHLLTLYNQALKFDFREEYDDNDEDEQFYEIMNGIREKNLEKILNDFNDDDEQDNEEQNEK